MVQRELSVFFLIFANVFFIFFPGSEALPFGTQASLYNSSDPIVLLSTSDFKRTVLATSNAWLIEFYSSWCGHCIDFAPAFRELANDVKDWGTVIKIGAVDCAKDENSPICREYEVMAYPTLKFFPAFSVESQLGIAYKQQKKVNTIRQAMIDFVENQFLTKASAPHWPILNLLGNETLEELWVHHFDHRTLILIFDTSENQYWSKELIMDFFPDKDYPPIRRVGESRKDLMEAFNVKSLPSLVIVDKPGHPFDTLPVKPDRKLAAQVIRDFLHPELESKKKAAPVPKEDRKEPAGVLFRPWKNEVYMSDLEKAILYSLGHEVILHKVISKVPFRSLKNYLEVLHAYFPGREKVKKIIKYTRDGLSRYDGHIRGEEFAKLFDDAIDNSDPDWRDEISEWKGCRGSQAHLRGYPCSLWTLWHMLTVSAAAKKDASKNPGQVIRAMKGYIQYFFGCSHCSNHFVDMTEDQQDPIEKIESLDGSILWLWKAHNKVNRRLAGDLTEDPQAPKVQFPTSELCPDCQSNGQWNEEVVLKFLKTFYSLKKTNMDGLDSSGGFGDETLEEIIANSPVEKSGAVSIHALQWTSLSLTKIDVSLCATVYLISAILLVGLLYKILTNRRFRKRLLGKF